mmetsp:Transcript_2254/g.4164  ORF Transcript_2254/g.4164 Transcript_2254/m.4164 type:complete len:237 (-) Transcript_2254:763-1473(-)
MSNPYHPKNPVTEDGLEGCKGGLSAFHSMRFLRCNCCRRYRTWLSLFAADTQIHGSRSHQSCHGPNPTHGSPMCCLQQPSPDRFCRQSSQGTAQAQQGDSPCHQLWLLSIMLVENITNRGPLDTGQKLVSNQNHPNRSQRRSHGHGHAQCRHSHQVHPRGLSSTQALAYKPIDDLTHASPQRSQTGNTRDKGCRRRRSSCGCGGKVFHNHGRDRDDRQGNDCHVTEIRRKQCHIHF